MAGRQKIENGAGAQRLSDDEGEDVDVEGLSSPDDLPWMGVEISSSLSPKSKKVGIQRKKKRVRTRRFRGDGEKDADVENLISAKTPSLDAKKWSLLLSESEMEHRKKNENWVSIQPSSNEEQEDVDVENLSSPKTPSMDVEASSSPSSGYPYSKTEIHSLSLSGPAAEPDVETISSPLSS